jgi:hypothetical protein
MRITEQNPELTLKQADQIILSIHKQIFLLVRIVAQAQQKLLAAMDIKADKLPCMPFGDVPNSVATKYFETNQPNELTLELHQTHPEGKSLFRSSVVRRSVEDVARPRRI